MLDLGAAPGSWTLYAAERVGARGHVVAVDLQVITQVSAPNVTLVQGDVLAPLREDAAADDPILANAPYDVVLSDMAPATSGSKVSDQARSFELFMKALEVALRVGKPGASFVGKIFMSGDFPLAKRAVTEHFETYRALKPEGTRASSTELFIVGQGLRAAR